ncbi:MAG: hypothetical protein ABIN80_06525 [Dyadobacter sp.]|uniref:hypothetical protein n=1 Tax=Dyadobacter sp. TaxID=1914288 RepID=UPI003265A6C6
MKTFQVKAVKESDQELVLKILQTLERKGMIVFEEDYEGAIPKKSTPATDEQVQEIIDEAELSPYYSEKEAKDILNL